MAPLSSHPKYEQWSSEARDDARRFAPLGAVFGTALAATVALARGKSQIFALQNVVACALSGATFTYLAHEWKFATGIHVRMRQDQLRALEEREARLKSQLGELEGPETKGKPGRSDAA